MTNLLSRFAVCWWLMCGGVSDRAHASAATPAMLNVLSRFAVCCVLVADVRWRQRSRSCQRCHSRSGGRRNAASSSLSAACVKQSKGVVSSLPACKSCSCKTAGRLEAWRSRMTVIYCTRSNPCNPSANSQPTMAHLPCTHHGVSKLAGRMALLPFFCPNTCHSDFRSGEVHRSKCE